MRHRAWHVARGQIAWILALVVSTAIVVRLEQIDFEGRVSLLTTNPFSVEPMMSDAMLAQVTSASWGSSDLHLAQKATSLALVLMSRAVSPEVATEAAETLAETRARSMTATPEDRPMLQVAATILEAALQAPDRQAKGN